MSDRLTQLSKTLAYILRHRPDSIELELDDAGWVDVSVLVSKMAGAGHIVTGTDLEEIARASGKKRYELEAGRIRAAQGHSIEVELGLEAEVPPPVLYHGTVERFLASIRTEGLTSGERRHVHLSADTDTAATVGKRRGSPVVLRIDAASMHAAGHKFFLAANGVWLVDYVPRLYLSEDL